VAFEQFSGRTIRVEGGLRARSTRGAIGSSWWSKRFLDVLESFALGGRLTRGKNYARRGQVLSLEIGPGAVVARVQGSRPTPYAVRVELVPFADEVWTAVEQRLAAQALFSAQLLAGELPAEIEDVFEAVRAPLFPRGLDELGLSCSCPDSAVPCKHLAATFYLLAEAFDDDPFQLLHWRGRRREDLLARLSVLRGASESPEPASGPTPAVSTVEKALSEVHTPELGDALDRFWLSPVPLGRKVQPVLAVQPDLLLRQLPVPGPRLGGKALVEALRALYHDLA
jgi:uncharacterized Zn finger protein